MFKIATSLSVAYGIGQTGADGQEIGVSECISHRRGADPSLSLLGDSADIWPFYRPHVRSSP